MAGETLVGRQYISAQSYYRRYVCIYKSTFFAKCSFIPYIFVHKYVIMAVLARVLVLYTASYLQTQA